MNTKIEHWVFLGDSLTEGIGSSRASFVNELADQLRCIYKRSSSNPRAVSYIRLKDVNPDTFDRFVKFNLIGYQDLDTNNAANQLVIWNFGAEATTIETDCKWIGLINILRPTKIIIFRGSLESIIRPSNFFDGKWPWWVPNSWRGVVAMDPRCYYSTAWWRKIKQVALDRLKQKVRLYLLKKNGGKALQAPEIFVCNYRKLIQHLDLKNVNVTMCGLLPVNERTFPASRNNFQHTNKLLAELAREYNVEFFDWGSNALFNECQQNYFYLDGFHPNKEGSIILGKSLVNFFSESLFGE